MNRVSKGESLRMFTAHLFDAVPVDSLVAFRVYFGLMVSLDCLEFIRKGLIATTFIEPVMLFKYYGFSWVHPWPGTGMYFHFVAAVVLGVCVSAGIYYRVTSVLLFMAFSYIFLLEKAIYLNHMYLICLITGTLSLLPVHRAFSFDTRRNSLLFSSTIPRWCLWLVRFQIALPYVYGGIAKLDRDWISGDVMFMFLMDLQDYPVFGRLMSSEPAVLFFTWGGLLFDLMIVPLLLWSRTRFAAFLCMSGFHLINSTLFDIGIFPWLMIGASTVFLPPDWPRRFLQVPFEKVSSTSDKRLSRSQQRTLAVAGLYVFFHLVFPFRHHLYPGDPSWTDEGQQFSWRMMTRAKLTRMNILAVDPAAGQQAFISPEKYLNPRQVRNLSRSPDLMMQFSHFLASEHRRLTGRELQVYWKANCSLNGRKPQLLIDPEINLVSVRRSLWPAKWILPLSSPSVSESIDKGLSKSSGTQTASVAEFPVESTSSAPKQTRNP